MESTENMNGHVSLTCVDADGNVRWTVEKANLITDAGDEYYAKRAVAGVNSNGESQPTLAAGMALGTSNTAAAKSSTGSAIVTYLSGSRKNFDSGSPDISGNEITYTVTWGAGEATTSGDNLAEIAITTNTTDTGGNSASTIARAVLSPTRPKQSLDTLTATWTHTFLGA